MGIPVPNTNRQAIWVAIATLLVLPAFVLLVPGLKGLHEPANYLPLHTLLELFSIAVAVLIAGIGWNATQGNHSGHLVVLSTGFLAVALLDIGHTLSYTGMPDFVSPSGAEKAIWFWLSARIASALTLLTVAFAPANWLASPALRLHAALASFAFVGIVYWIILFHLDWLPRTFVPGTGLTAFKIGAEYIVCGVFALAALLVWLRPINGSAFRGPVLLAALLIMVASEAAFTLYAAVHDAFNLLGHLYKVVATYLIYRAVFVDAVTAPYVRLAFSERKYRDILEHAADAIIRVQSDGLIIDANKRAADLFHSDELLDRSAETYIDGWHDCPTQLAIDGAAIWEAYVRSDSAPTPLEISARRLRSGEIQAIIRDISERKQHEEQLRAAIEHAEQASRAKSQFLANMSHELRTPLNAILGFSEVLQQEIYGPLGDAHYREYAADIHKSGKHLFHIIEDLLDIARIESGHIQLHEEDLDLGSVIADCVRIIEPSAQHVRLLAPPLRGAITVRADERALRQVLLNLLSNAAKFTPNGGTVEISGQITSDGDIAIDVRDTGIGIQSADLARVTQAFVQVEAAYARKHQGVGLGLAIAKALIELHGGSLLINSAQNAGTTVTVLLPGKRIVAPSLAALA